MEGFPWLWDSALPCMQLVNAPNWKYPGGTFNQWLVSMGGSTSHVPWIQVWDDTKLCYTPLPKVYRCPERWPHCIPRALLAAFPSLPHVPSPPCFLELPSKQTACTWILVSGSTSRETQTKTNPIKEVHTHHFLLQDPVCFLPGIYHILSFFYAFVSSLSHL